MSRPTATAAAFVAAVAASVLVAGSAALASPRAPSGAACPTNEGVTVIVDFNGLGGRDVEIGCAPGSVTSSFDALRKAGFTLTPVSNQPFLCKIDGHPSEQTCQRPAPTTAYWSYWTAPRGGSWTYAQEGGGTRVPPAGSVDGWSFAQVSSEDQAPPPGRTPPPPPTTTTVPTEPPPTVAPHPDVTTPPTSGSTPTTRKGATTTTGAPVATDGTTPLVPADSSTTSLVDGSSSTSTSVDPEEQASVTLSSTDDEGGGSLVGVALGGTLVAVVAVGALVTARRRGAGEPVEEP